MKESDFFELKIGSVVYLDGKKKTVNFLGKRMDEKSLISFDLWVNSIEWSEIKKDCSLEPPKKKKIKLYRHLIKKASGTCLTAWYDTKLDNDIDFIMLKTEEKEIEIEE